MTQPKRRETRNAKLAAKEFSERRAAIVEKHHRRSRIAAHKLKIGIPFHIPHNTADGGA
jgi:hypothetical protein